MEEQYQNYLTEEQIMLTNSPLVEYKDQQQPVEQQAPPPQQHEEEDDDEGDDDDEDDEDDDEEGIAEEPAQGEQGEQGEDVMGESVFSNVGAGLSGHYRNMMMAYWQETINAIEHEEHDFKNHQLPLARIKKVMKTDEEVRMISAEAPILFAKGCDIFITELTMRAWIHAEENKRRTLQRSDIAAALQKSDMFDFLIDIVPREDDRPKRHSTSRQGSMGYPPSAQPPLQQPQQPQQPPQQAVPPPAQQQQQQQQQPPAQPAPGQQYEGGEYSTYADINYENRY